MAGRLEPAAKTVAPDKRIWVRHRANGHVGWLVNKGGIVKVKLDREDPYALKPYDAKQWTRMEEVTAVPRMALALVQWKTDRELLRALGDRKRSKMDWHMMPVPARIKFMDEGPKDGAHLEVRKAVWQSIKDATRELVEGKT